MRIDEQGIVRDLETYRDELANELLDMEETRHRSPQTHAVYNTLRIVFLKIHRILKDGDVPSYREELEK